MGEERHRDQLSAKYAETILAVAQAGQANDTGFPKCHSETSSVTPDIHHVFHAEVADGRRGQDLGLSQPELDLRTTPLWDLAGPGRDFAGFHEVDTSDVKDDVTATERLNSLFNS